MKTDDKIIIVDNGSQYTHLIAKIIRNHCHVYCEVVKNLPKEKFKNEWKTIKGIILSGGPQDIITQKASQHIQLDKIQCPVLGICYGAQFIANYYGATIVKENSEYGKTEIIIHSNNDSLFNQIPSTLNVWMSHSNSIVESTSSYTHMNILSVTQNGNIAAFKIRDKQIYGVLFHPEVSHTEKGEHILLHFIEMCECERNWVPKQIVNTLIHQLKETIGGENVLMAISGGVDSTVAATLINKAIGKKLLCVFIDNGLLRKNEFEDVLETYKNMNLNVVGIHAKKKFIQQLHNIVEPERKRKRIGKTFIDIFTDYSSHLPQKYKFLGQGTIYSDVIESSHSSHCSRKIKAHHNVGALPEELDFELIEPLRYLFKDEVRIIGKIIDIPDKILNRHPFPGPGLAIRIIGNITNYKINILQEADHIFTTMLKEHHLYKNIWQAAVILLNTKTVGVMGDERSYNYVVALRAVCSKEGMTASIYPFTMDFLESVSNKIINHVKGINRVVYDISSKPPATIEWE